MTNIFDKSPIAFIQGFIAGIIYFITSSLLNTYLKSDFIVNLTDVEVVFFWLFHLLFTLAIISLILKIFIKKRILIFNVFSIMISILVISLLMNAYIYKSFPLFSGFTAVILIIFELFNIFSEITHQQK